MIIDAHLHLDDRIDGTVLSAARELDRQLAEAGVARGVVLQLETQPWSLEEVSEALAQFPRLRAFVNVHPHARNSTATVRNAVERLGYIGLKLHPRLQKFRVEDDATIKLVRYAGELGIPVLLDAFPDGAYLIDGFSALKYGHLSQKCSETRIIWAHMGGHHVFDFLMLAKRLPNTFFDMSYSLLYYQQSSVAVDMVYAMRSMKFDRIFYGSDYPDRSVVTTLQLTTDFLVAQGVSNSELAKVMFDNASQFFRWGKS